jgi:hypothetical protein
LIIINAAITGQYDNGTAYASMFMGMTYICFNYLHYLRCTDDETR